MSKFFNAEQMAQLKKYERNFSTAVNARWSSFLSDKSFADIKAVWDEFTGEERPLRGGCSACLLNLLVDVGSVYFATLDYNKQKATEKAVAEQKEPKTAKTSTKKEKAVKSKKSK